MRPLRKPRHAARVIASVLLAAAMALPAGPAKATASVGDYVGKTPAEIAASLERQGYQVEEFETERGFFEVEASIDGKRYEIHVDPRTGKVAKIGKDD